MILRRQPDADQKSIFGVRYVSHYRENGKNALLKPNVNPIVVFRPIRTFFSNLQTVCERAARLHFQISFIGAITKTIHFTEKSSLVSCCLQ